VFNLYLKFNAMINQFQHQIDKTDEILKEINHQADFLRLQLGRMGRKEEQEVIKSKLLKAVDTMSKTLTLLEQVKNEINH
jgi:hypothetical protein